MGKCLKRDIWVLAGCCMSPLTLAMKDDGFPFRLTSLALELHFFSMYYEPRCPARLSTPSPRPLA